jgi:flagellar hook-basal body complex protein FliE
MEMNQINPIGPIREGESTSKAPATGTPTGGPSFKETLNSFMSDVNNLQQKADVDRKSVV